MSINDAKLTDAEINKLGGDAGFDREIVDAATRKTWWTMVQTLEQLRLNEVNPIVAHIDGHTVRLAGYFADLARAAGLEPWGEE